MTLCDIYFKIIPMEMTMPLRQRKKAKTRQALIEAAMVLFDRQGYEATTVGEIAAAADVSRRTFFRYFATKALVLFPHQDLHLDHFRELLRDQRPGEAPFDRLRRACMEMARLYMEGREEHLRQQRIIRNSPALIAKGDQFDEDWRALIKEALLLGTAPNKRTERHAYYLAAAVMGVIGAVMREWYDGDCRADLAAMGDEGLALLEKGVNGWIEKA